jgi:hypothetical protein
MGWGEARTPPVPSRGDLCRQLADALGETIPEWVTAEQAWPLLISQVDRVLGYYGGDPLTWPPDPDAAPERDTCPTCHTPRALPPSTVCPRCGSTHFGRLVAGPSTTPGAPPREADVYVCHDCHHERPAD